MKKKTKLLCLTLSLIFLVLGISGCGSNQKFAEYREWYKTLHIGWHRGIHVHSLAEKEDYLQVGIKCDPEHLDSLNKVIQTHNEFALTHPGYFGDIVVEFDAVYSSGAGYFRYLNKPHENFSGSNADWMQCDGTIMYLEGNLYDFTSAYAEHRTEFPEPVLILETEDPGFFSEEDYEFLNQFTNLEQVIVKYSGEYNMDDVVQRINKYT